MKKKWNANQEWRQIKPKWMGASRRSWRSYCGRSLTIFHRVTDGNGQGATTAAGLPLHLSQNQQSRWKWRQFLPSLLRTHKFDCVWYLYSTLCKCFTIFTLDVCGRASAGKNARRARCVECLSARVYKFSSPAVKPGQWFNISSLTLEFEYLVGVIQRTETSVCELVSAASWYTAEFSLTNTAVLRIMGTTSTSVLAGSTPQTCR